MEKFQFYKKRDFGAYISDTFQYFKLYWKNFFANYLVINGLMLIAISVVFFFIFKDMFGSLFSMGQSTNPDVILGDNLPYFIGLIGLAMLLTFVFSIFSISYPIVHMRLVETTDRATFTSSELFVELKKVFKRVFVFSLLAGLLMIPTMLIVAAIGIATIVLLVGFFVLFMGLPAIMVLYYQGLFIYVNNPEIRFWDAVRRAWKSLFINFKELMSTVGSSVVMYMIISTLTGIISMIPYMIILFGTLSTGEMEDPSGLFSLMTALYIVNIILSYLLLNFAMVQQGMIYYSHLEEEEHVQAFSEIDEIGKS